MLHSIEALSLRVGVFDLGLSLENKKKIAHVCNFNCSIIDPGWCVSLPPTENTPEYKKVFLAKPFIPNLFPGFSKYLWVDADIWFQDCSALEDYLEAADSSGIAICYEDHPLYQRSEKKRLPKILEQLRLKNESYKSKRLRKYFGRASARKWGDSPTLNSGIFCITAESSVWRHWQDTVRRANLQGHEGKRLICDQTCLDLAVLENNLSPTKMPATHNWCLSLAAPMIQQDTGLLVDPIAPHLPIKVLHSIGSKKNYFGSLPNHRTSVDDNLCSQ